jgi:hypothetical protein
MPEKSFAIITGFVAVTIVCAALSAAAQTQTPTGPQGTSLTLPHARTQIEIYPRGPLYRRCTTRIAGSYALKMINPPTARISTPQCRTKNTETLVGLSSPYVDRKLK